VRVLVFNYGSSTVRSSIVDVAAESAESSAAERVVGAVAVERIGQSEAFIRDDFATEPAIREVAAADHAEAIDQLHARLRSHDLGEIGAVGHRVVHGGERFRAATRVDDEVERAIEALIPLAPLHNPLSLAGIRAARDAFPGVVQVAVFDTAFHHTLPPRAYVYPIPYEFYEQDRMRRYGFHGTSHRHAAERAASLLGLPPDGFTGITCHLGNGASVAAVENGRSIDTSMGLTPLEGLMMGTRSGDLDPGLQNHIAASRGWTSEEVVELLSERSGLLGVSGVSSDLRDIERAAEAGNSRAELALEIFAYRVRKYIGAYASVVTRIDAIVLTGGIGENSASVRQQIAEGLAYLGVVLDPALNRECAGREACVSPPGVPVPLLVVPSREDRVIAREVQRLLGDS